METIAKFLLSAVELAEAELRSFQSGIMKLGLKLVAVVVAGVLALIGAILIVGAIYLLLAHLLGDIAALAIVGACFAGSALGLLAWAFHKPKRSPVAGAYPSEAVVGETGVKDESAQIRMAS